MTIITKTLSVDWLPYTAEVTVDTVVQRILSITLSSNQADHTTIIELIPNAENIEFRVPNTATIDGNEVDISQMHREDQCTVQNVHFGSEVCETLLAATCSNAPTELQFTLIWQPQGVLFTGSIPEDLSYYDSEM